EGAGGLRGPNGTGVAGRAYSPPASGILTGKSRRGESPPAQSRLGADALASRMFREGLMARRPPLSDERLTTVEQLARFAQDRGHQLLDLAISWVAAQPVVGSVLTGVTSSEQVVANAAAANWHLTTNELDATAGIAAAEP